LRERERKSEENVNYMPIFIDLMCGVFFYSRDSVAGTVSDIREYFFAICQNEGQRIQIQKLSLVEFYFLNVLLAEIRLLDGFYFAKRSIFQKKKY
jgi:hypothetical protein